MVSILVPVYNIEKYLPGCVKSLLAQTESNIEILLVNDGSTDGSGKLCNSLAASDQRIRVIHKENGGLSSARNAGIKAAKGQWLLFVDGDDYLAPFAVSRLLEFAREDIDFVQFLYRETDGTWVPEDNRSADPQTETDSAAMWRRLYEMGGVYASSCTKLWNRRVLEEDRFREGILHEDEELLNRVLPKCRKAVYTRLELYGYVMRSGSIIRSGFKRGSMDVFPIMEQRIGVLEKMGLGDLAQATRSRLFQTAAWQYCLARKGGFRQEAAQLKQKLKALAGTPGLSLQGQYAALYRAVRLTPAAVNVYYLVRRVCGKT